MLDSLADLIASEYSDRKLLTFCPLRATSRQWTDALKARGLPAAHVQGDSPDRADILEAFGRGEIRFLSNSSVLTEGYDEPSIDTVLMLRPTRSRGLFSQCVGRGTRLFPGKDRLLVLDPMFISERHNIMTAASLVALDDKQEKRVSELMNDGLGLEEAKNCLAEALAAASMREAYEKRLAELAFALDYAELASYEPTMRWHHHKPSEAQIAALIKAGVEISAITSKGLASEVLGKMAERRAKGLATIKQVRFARGLGHPAPETLSFAMASAWLNEHSTRSRAA